jgi:hypothetical protein
MLRSAVLLIATLFSGGAFAQQFVVQEIIDAHRAASEALGHLADANARHQGQFGGHEGKARQLLEQARHEMEEADKFFREHPKPPR